jgi:ribonuclease HII
LKTQGPDLSFEKILWRAGVNAVAGIDEAGRGALAGPVTAAAVILPAQENILSLLEGVRDSKQMTPAQRNRWKECIKKVASAWGVGFASVEEIDRLGILPATHLAAERALEELSIAPEHLILDYLFLSECALPQTSLIKGDQRSLSVAAASVLAKTARDAFMVALNAQVPGFGFDRHKGYGTALHRSALEALGLSPVHRKTFHLHRGVQNA